MKAFYFIILSSFSLFCGAQNSFDESLDSTLNGLGTYSCGFYITRNNDTIKAKRISPYYLNKFIAEHVAFQEEVQIIDSSGIIHTFKPSDIRSFSLKRLGRICRYDAVNVDGKDLFLRNTIDGTILKRYALYTPGYKIGRTVVTPILCKNNIAIQEYSNEDRNKTMSLAISDYPLLSQIMAEKKCDLDSKRELKVILNEYNTWMALRSNGLVDLKDTSMAVRGLLDAGKHFKPQVNFWFNFLVNGLLTPIVGLPVALISGFTNPLFLNLPRKELKKNTDYIKAYKAKAYFLKNNSAAKGNLCGYGLLIGILITRIITNH